MQPLGDQLLARPALADDQHRPVERRRAAGALDRIEKGQALPDELRGALHLAQQLVINPTIWQEFSHRRSSKNGRFVAFRALFPCWHDRCIGYDQLGA